jgi:membrane protease YdiL (CAAX protease family)
METQLRELVALGIGLLLILLRLDAERFGAAEYDEPVALWSMRRDRDGGRLDTQVVELARNPAFRRRAAWYLIGIGLVAVAFVAHPSPHDDLHLAVGDRTGAIVGGLALGAIGAGQAVAFAWLRYRRLRLPSPWSYPGAVINAVGTAIVDEAAFRGILLGFLLVAGVDPLSANLVQAIVYVLATRLGAPGRSRYMLFLAIWIGVTGGWLTLVTGGIAAATIAQIITRVGLFVATGHAGRVVLRDQEVEDEVRVRRPPEGWQMVDEGRASPRPEAQRPR